MHACMRFSLFAPVSFSVCLHIYNCVHTDKCICIIRLGLVVARAISVALDALSDISSTASSIDTKL